MEGCLDSETASTPFAVDYRKLLEGSLDMVWLVRVKGNSHETLYSSPSVFPVLGWTVEEMLQKTPRDIFTPEAMLVVAEADRQMTMGLQTNSVTLEAVRKDGGHIWLENKIRLLDTEPDGTIRVAVYMRDVTDRKLLQDRLSQLAYLDGLTGIQNRRAFDAALDREWRRAVRSELPLSLVLLDLDRFKPFNDTYGHLAGDECLRTVAETVRNGLQRPEDVVARYGGEELAVLLPDTDLSGADIVAKRLCAGVMDLQIPHSGNDGRGIVTISGGVSTALAGSAGKARTPKGLLQAADSALYKAKHMGRNQVATSLLLKAPGVRLRRQKEAAD